MASYLQPKAHAADGKMHPLTSFRFFAALYVVGFHASTQFHMPAGVPLTLQHVLKQLISLGFVSVSFFFLLSGYILAFVYLRGDRPVDVRRFYTARLARIYPLFLLTLLLDTPNLLYERILHYGTHTAILKTAATVVGNLFMLQAWTTNLRGLNSPSWSLSVETFLYLLFPFLGVALWFLRGRRVLIAMAAFYLGGQALALLLSRYIPSQHLEYQPLLHLSTFALGILLARFQVDQQQARTITRNTVAVAQAPSLVLRLALPVAFLAFLAIAFLPKVLPFIAMHDGLFAPLFALSIWSLSHPHLASSRLLSARWLVLLGEASFGLYLIHYPVLHLVMRLGLPLTLATFVPYLAVCIGLSLASFFFFEGPARRLVLARFQTRTKESMELASAA